ncbi:hypothetical protein DTO96_102411 [Ephemeroptericola cinctiostellae]|uniref:Terminase small subunit n=1 Tax=Ephemeroptericola cinctiostellae TaxID=2268024 RepID=A0A345DE68_9BURK|nr:hypothetical protein [Ephemeroptericola cinctiostellae]AXF86656.1 hypothetical protein DTO96_102411 [Ephemeroptericola cinctiostellae]
MLKSVEDLADIEVGVKVLEVVLGVSEQYIGRLVKDGVLPKSGRGAYPLTACIRAFVDNLRDKQKSASTNEDGSVKVNAAYELAVLRQKQGTLVDIRIQTELAQLVRTDEAERIFAEVIADAKTQFQALPVKMATKLEGLPANDIYIALHEYAHETLKRLSVPVQVIDQELLDQVLRLEQSTQAEIEELEQNDE